MVGQISNYIILELTVQEEVKVPGGGAERFSGVVTDFQNVGLGNNAPC